MKPIDMTSKYRTRDGRAVRVLCVDRRNDDYPVVALVANALDWEEPHTFTSAGRYYKDGADSELDLFEVRETVRFAAIFRDGSLGAPQSTPVDAGCRFPDGVVGIVKITITNGTPSVELVTPEPRS